MQLQSQKNIKRCLETKLKHAPSGNLAVPINLVNIKSQDSKAISPR